MIEKFKEFIYIFLVVLIFFGAAIVDLYRMTANAQGSIMTKLTVNRNEIRQGQYFTVDVKIGGNGVKILRGQSEEIYFSVVDARIELPRNSIPLKDDKTGRRLGKVSFEDKKVVIKFNDFASTLDDIKGEFNFNVFGYRTKDISKDGEGKIDIVFRDENKSIKFINEKG